MQPTIDTGLSYTYTYVRSFPLVLLIVPVITIISVFLPVALSLTYFSQLAQKPGGTNNLS